MRDANVVKLRSTLRRRFPDPLGEVTLFVLPPDESEPTLNAMNGPARNLAGLQRQFITGAAAL